jgi:hypothetical protein
MPAHLKLATYEGGFSYTGLPRIPLPGNFMDAQICWLSSISSFLSMVARLMNGESISHVNVMYLQSLYKGTVTKGIHNKN